MQEKALREGLLISNVKQEDSLAFRMLDEPPPRSDGVLGFSIFIYQSQINW